MNITVEQREEFLELLSAEYTIPEDMISCVVVAIRQYATKKYSDVAIEKLVRTPQSLISSLALIRERNGKNDLSLFRGMICEWLVCVEYNALKNKGDVVITILNPDPSSKADLLHIIRTKHGYKAVPGPDVKSGGSTYVFNQWEKIVNYRYDIPMVDIDGVLTTEEGLKQLTKSQRQKLEFYYEKHPNKRPITTSWSKEDIGRIIADYLKFIEFKTLPSDESDLSIKDISVPSIKKKLYSKTIETRCSFEWTTFCKDSKRILQSSEKGDLIHAETVLNVQSVQQAPSDKITQLPKEANSFGKKALIWIGEKINWLSKHPEIVKASIEIVSTIAEGIIEQKNEERRVQANAYKQIKKEASYSYLISDDYEQDSYTTENEPDYHQSRATQSKGKKAIDTPQASTNASTNEKSEDIIDSTESRVINYPKHRKHSKVHPMRRSKTGEIYAVRGGTPEEKEALRKKLKLT